MLLAMTGKADSVATELRMEDALEAGLEETNKLKPVLLAAGSDLTDIGISSDSEAFGDSGVLRDSDVFAVSDALGDSVTLGESEALGDSDAFAVPEVLEGSAAARDWDGV
jgi:hypothetical protein